MDIRTRIPLNNGTSIPLLGFGVWQAKDGEETRRAVTWALETGYRHIDTAAAYGNEHSVGQAMRDSGIPREEIFLTTKLWNEDQRRHNQMKAFEDSLKRLGTDYVDLYLIHWPVAGVFVESWKVMEEIYKSGRAKAIGVSNFKIHHLETLLAQAEIVPAADQMEFNPLMQDNDLLAFCREKGIVFEAWSPLGVGSLTNDQTTAAIGSKYGKTGPQAILRWIIQKNIPVFPKSVHKERILQNADIFDFELSPEDMATIDAMNRNQRSGADPDNFHF